MDDFCFLWKRQWWHQLPLGSPTGSTKCFDKASLSVKALAAEGWLRRFLVLVGTLTAWKKGRGKHVLIIEYGKCCRKKCESSGSKICTKDPNRMQGCEMQLIIKLGRSLGHPAATTLKTKKAGKDCSIINRLVIHSPLLCSAKSRWK